MQKTAKRVFRGCFGFALLITILKSLRAQSVTFTRQPPNPQVIVEGVNSRRVWLVWRFTLNSSETLRSITIERKRPGENVPTRIATRPYANSSFILVNNKFKEKYSARSPSTLVLKDVKRTDEYIYSLEVFYWNGIRNGRKKSDVHVLVFVPPSITIAPVEEVDVEAGKDLTLTCNASGDPQPNITWSKDGVTLNQLSGTGYQLHLVKVKREDAGSYRCTASNGYGDDATSVSIVDIKFPLRITLAPVRKAEIEIGKDLMLVCHASGAPTPNITWTKEGFSVNEFNATGHFLRFVNASRMTAGSYRCTASNGYGKIATSVTIVSIKCDEKCKPQRVGITLTNETWKQSLLNRDSTEFKNLESNVLSAIWNVYARDFGRELYKVTVEGFRPGSVVAIVELVFGKSASDPLKPLQDEISDGKLSSFKVNAMLDVDPGIPPTPTRNLTKTAAANADWIKERQLLHALYSSVIFLLLVIVTVLVILLWRRRNNEAGGHSNNNASCRYQRKNDMDIKDHGESLQANGAYVNISGCLMLSEEETTVIQSSPSRNTLPNRRHQIDSEYMSIKGVTKSKDWEVSRENVHISKVIGKGAFCQVAKATASNIRGIKGTKTVAVKMLKENAPDTDKKDLLSELELMKKLKPHPHVIKLMGCVTKTDPLLVLIEYIPYGDLLGYLRKSRGLNDSYYKDPDVKPETNLTSKQLMQFAWQIADGMKYLSSNKIIHRDLAARNVLVGEGEKCKVTDFGMARNVQQDDIYTKQSRGRLPVKWTAYEGLVYGKYTTQSDVWSFGVVLYEIFTVGGSPYPGIKARDIASKLQQGYRMPKPKHVDGQLHQIMLQCWQQNPNDRPTFSTLKQTITKMAENNNDAYIDMKEYDTSLYANVDDL